MTQLEPAPMQAVYAQLRHEILSGRFEAGIPFSQVKLAQRLGVSRTPLREALRLLEREGLVETSHNRRSRVAVVSVENVDDLYGTRIMVECLAVAMSMRFASDGDVERIQELLTQMDGISETRDTLAWEVPHAAFHEAVIAHSGSRSVQICRDLRDFTQMYRTRVLIEPLAWSEASKEHRDIASAFASGLVSETASALARHYARTALTLITRLDPQYDPVRIRTALRFVEAGGWIG
jgi:DNA-binding GntR family transcriptional regulator